MHLLLSIYLLKNLYYCTVWKSYSKFGEDCSISHVTILPTDAGHQRPDIGYQTRQVILYSVQCYVLHWTDNNTVTVTAIVTDITVSKLDDVIFLRS